MAVNSGHNDGIKTNQRFGYSAVNAEKARIAQQQAMNEAQAKAAAAGHSYVTNIDDIPAYNNSGSQTVAMDSSGNIKTEQKTTRIIMMNDGQKYTVEDPTPRDRNSESGYHDNVRVTFDEANGVQKAVIDDNNLCTQRPTTSIAENLSFRQTMMTRINEARPSVNMPSFKQNMIEQINKVKPSFEMNKAEMMESHSVQSINEQFMQPISQSSITQSVDGQPMQPISQGSKTNRRFEGISTQTVMSSQGSAYDKTKETAEFGS